MEHPQFKINEDQNNSSDKRLIIFGGKGGVGKSSISSSTAVFLSHLLPDKNILLISFDIAHNLGDLFNKEIGNDITQIRDNLYVIEPDPEEYTLKYLGKLEEKTHELVKASIILSNIPDIQKFITGSFKGENLPLGFKNSLFFQKIVDSDNPLEGIDGDNGFNSSEEEKEEEKFDFDIVIADFPPTGSMLTLFEIPLDFSQRVLKYSLELQSGINKFMGKFKGTLDKLNPLKFLFNKAMPITDQRDAKSKLNKDQRKDLSGDIVKILNEINQRGDRVRELFKNNGSLRLVSIPEKPSFNEIKTASILAQKYIKLEGIHINKLIPQSERGKSQFLDQLIGNQQRYRNEINTHFKDFNVWESHLSSKEPIGIDELYKLGKEIYGEHCKAEEILFPNNYNKNKNKNKKRSTN